MVEDEAMMGRCQACPSKDAHIAAQQGEIDHLRKRNEILETQLAEIAGVRATLKSPGWTAAEVPPGPRERPSLPVVPWINTTLGDGHASMAEARRKHERAHPKAAVGPTPTTSSGTPE